MPPKPIRAPNRAAWMKEYKRRQNYRKRRAAATKIQRNFRKRKGATKYAREIKNLEMTSQTYTCSASAAGAQQMKHGVIIPVGMFNTHAPKLTQGTGENDLVGVWLQPRYLVSRYIVDWSSLTGHADLSKGVEFRIRYGYIKTTGYKAGAALTSVANWCTDIDKTVHAELQNSGLDDNFLTFSKRNRTVHILGDFMLRPDLRHRVADTDSQNHDFSPPKNFQIDWHKKQGFPRMKQRMTHATDGYVPNNSWPCFVYISSNNITVNMGALNIHTSSKYYFSDP
jgi:hypothetical protein